MADAVDPTLEREYNPRILAPEATGIYAAWPGRAAAFRDRHPPETHRYGPHEREVFDLFRAPAPRGTVVFIHGGYWRAFSKDDFSWVAADLVDQGLTVVLPSYPLCPDVRLPRIVEALRAAFRVLWTDRLGPAERSRVVVTGHSAGGYLAALHLATDWTAHGLPAAPLAGIVPISGVFDLRPLVRTSMNEALRLDEAAAAALDLTGRPPLARAPATFVVGGAESASFHAQSERLAGDWAVLDPRVVAVPDRNHFDVIDGLADPEAELNRTIRAMIAGPVSASAGG